MCRIDALYLQTALSGQLGLTNGQSGGTNGFCGIIGGVDWVLGEPPLILEVHWYSQEIYYNKQLSLII